MTEPPAHLCPRLDIASDAIQPALLLNDAREPQIATIETNDLRFEKRMPPQMFA
jgi:hypothetical protein